MASSTFVSFPLKQDAKIKSAQVHWAVLEKPDPGPDFAPKPNHQITVVVTPALKADLQALATKIGASGINGLKIRQDGTETLTIKTTKYASKGIQSFQDVSSAMPSPALPIRRGDTVTILASPGLVRNGNKLSLFLKSVSVEAQPPRDNTGGTNADVSSQF